MGVRAPEPRKAPKPSGPARPLRAVADDRLAALGGTGDREAFAEIYERHHRGVLSLCRHVLRSPEEAEDAVQDTFTSAFGDLARRPRDLRLRPWLYTIARNRCLTLLRARREQPVEEIEQPTAGLSEEVEQRAELRELLGDLGRLPVEQRTALVLAELDDMAHADVARVLGCDTAKVRALVFQARTGLAGWRQAHEAACTEIRQQVAWGSGGILRRRTLRRHLTVCADCAGFAQRVKSQRKGLAVVLPVLPTAALRDRTLEAALSAAGGLAGVGAGGASSGAGAATGGGGAAAIGGGALAGGLGGWLGAGMSTGTAAKVVAAALVAGGGLTAVAVERGDHGRPADAGPQRAGATTTGARKASTARERREPPRTTADTPASAQGKGQALTAQPAASAPADSPPAPSTPTPSPPTPGQAPAPAAGPGPGAGEQPQSGDVRVDLRLPGVEVPELPVPRVEAPRTPPLPERLPSTPVPDVPPAP